MQIATLDYSAIRSQFYISTLTCASSGFVVAAVVGQEVVVWEPLKGTSPNLEYCSPRQDMEIVCLARSSGLAPDVFGLWRAC